MSAHQSVERTSRVRDIERRSQRFSPPPCSSCGSADTSVTCRTPYVIYVRCWGCGAVWSEPKPGVEQAGS